MSTQQTTPTKLNIIRLLTLIYILSIYITLPYMRGFLNYIQSSFGRESLMAGVNIALFIAAMVIFIMFVRKGFYRFVITAIPLVLMALWIVHMEIPEERIHFLQYGTLGILSFYAFRGDSIKQIGYAFLLAAGAGVLDEIIQHFLPSRVGDIRDVAFNTIGAALGVLIATLYSYKKHKDV